MDDDRALFRARHCKQIVKVLQRFQRVVDVVGSQQRIDLFLVGDDDVGVIANEFHEGIAMPLDAKRIRQRQGDRRAVAARDLRGFLASAGPSAISQT